MIPWVLLLIAIVVLAGFVAVSAWLERAETEVVEPRPVDVIHRVELATDAIQEA